MAPLLDSWAKLKQRKSSLSNQMELFCWDSATLSWEESPSLGSILVTSHNPYMANHWLSLVQYTQYNVGRQLVFVMSRGKSVQPGSIHIQRLVNPESVGPNQWHRAFGQLIPGCAETHSFCQILYSAPALETRQRICEATSCYSYSRVKFISHFLKKPAYENIDIGHFVNPINSLWKFLTFWENILVYSFELWFRLIWFIVDWVAQRIRTCVVRVPHTEPETEEAPMDPAISTMSKVQAPLAPQIQTLTKSTRIRASRWPSQTLLPTIHFLHSINLLSTIG